MTGFDQHLESLSSLPEEVHTCDHCHTREEKQWLWLHVETGHRLCQSCLAKFLEKDIEDSEEHVGKFEGWKFRKSADPWLVKMCGPYEAVKDEEPIQGGKTVAEVLEYVLMRLNYI